MRARWCTKAFGLAGRAGVTFLLPTSLRPITDFCNFKRVVLASVDGSVESLLTDYHPTTGGTP